MAKDTYTDVHMALPNGGASCGSDGPAEPDVNLVTCLKCLETPGWPRRTTDAVEKAKRQTYTSVNGNMRKIARRIVAGKDADDDTLRKTIEWIGNLNDAFGREAVLDHMPNNFGGTIAIQSLINAGGSGSDESALLRAAKYTLENLDAAEREKLISAPRSFQAQLGESAKMLREAIAGR